MIFAPAGCLSIVSAEAWLILPAKDAGEFLKLVAEIPIKTDVQTFSSSVSLSQKLKLLSLADYRSLNILFSFFIFR